MITVLAVYACVTSGPLPGCVASMALWGSTLHIQVNTGIQMASGLLVTPFNRACPAFGPQRPAEGDIGITQDSKTEQSEISSTSSERYNRV